MHATRARRRQTLAVDVSIWLTQFIKAMRDDDGKVMKNAHIIGTLRRVVSQVKNSRVPSVEDDDMQWRHADMQAFGDRSPEHETAATAEESENTRDSLCA